MPQMGKRTGCKQKTQRQVSFPSWGKPPSTVFSPLFAHPPSLHQVKAADGFALVTPHTSWPICAADDQTGTLQHDPSYTVKCCSKELFIKEVISGCTFTRGGRKVGRKEGGVFVCSPPTHTFSLPVLL